MLAPPLPLMLDTPAAARYADDAPLLPPPRCYAAPPLLYALMARYTLALRHGCHYA